MILDKMIELISYLLPVYKTKCTHDKVPPEVETAYCPDCGKLIKNEWYIGRCSSCGVKVKVMVRNGEIISQNHFCTNCGGNDFKIEKLDKINFIDINFAALLKSEVVETSVCKTTTCWQEKIHEQPKLLIQY